MIIYTKNENYKIWANTEDRKFYIQMAGKEREEQGHDTAAIAINAIEDIIEATVDGH